MKQKHNRIMTIPGKDNLWKKCDALWMIGLYIRLSREDEYADESMSIVHQRKLLYDFVERMDEQCVLVDEYVDDGASGTDYDRPGFRRMLGDIEAERVNCVVVKDLARPFRNYADQGYFLESYFPEHGVRFISLGLPPLDSYKHPEMMNSIMVPIQGVINDNHCRETSIKVRAVFDMKRSKGEYIGGFGPFGYRCDPNDKSRLVIDEEAAPIVRSIYSWFVHEGCGETGIAKRLNAMGVPHPALHKYLTKNGYHRRDSIPNDGLWSFNAVYRILTNRTYIGDMVQGKRTIVSYKVHKTVDVPEENWYIVTNTHEPIIEQDTFDQAQSLLQRTTRTGSVGKSLHLFAGFLCCADCGKAMTRTASRQYVYYRCKTHVRKSPEKCSPHSIRLDTLETAVLTAVREQIAMVKSLADVVEEVNGNTTARTRSKRLASLLNKKEAELERMQHVMDDLYVDWRGGEVIGEDYRRMKARFEGRMEKLHREVSSIQGEMQAVEVGVGADDPFLASFIRHGNIMELNRGILSELVRMIYVHESGELTIDFNFSDEHRRTVEHTQDVQEVLAAAHAEVSS